MSNPMALRGPSAGPLNMVRSWLWNAIVVCGRLLALLAWLFPRQLKPTTGKGNLHPTSYLDALRGYAAWIVYHIHISREEWRPTNRWLFILFNGTAQVYTFYVISGFALSYSALGRIHRQQPVLDSLASSIFRRYFRLYLPMAFATFIAMLVIATGLGKWGSAGTNPTQPTFWGNVWYWVGDTVQLINPFFQVSPLWHPNVHGSTYLVQIWTIPIEFRGSMVVFLFLTGLATAKPWVRTGMLLASGIMSCWWRTPYAALFLAGTWFADLHQWRNQQSRGSTDLPISAADVVQAPPSPAEYVDELKEYDDSRHSSISSASEDVACHKEGPLEEPLLRHNTLQMVARRFSFSGLRKADRGLLREVPYFVIFFIGVWLLASPATIDANSPFPYNWVAAIAPPSWKKDLMGNWPMLLSSITIVFALEHSPTLRRPLNTAFSQWLGELSFGIYTMHNTVRYALWDKYFMPWQAAYFGEHALDVTSFIPSYVILTIAVLWAAEVFRWVDVKCVNLSKIMADKAFR